MIDAIDCGNEVRKLYVPKHVQMPEARKSDEVTLLVGDDNLKTITPSENIPPVAEPELGFECKKKSELLQRNYR